MRQVARKSITAQSAGITLDFRATIGFKRCCCVQPTCTCRLAMTCLHASYMPDKGLVGACLAQSVCQAFDYGFDARTLGVPWQMLADGLCLIGLLAPCGWGP